MQAIADWLEKLGMSEYVQRFADNGITVEALRHLTDQDLKDIGVLLGHRRIMLPPSASLAVLRRQHLRAPQQSSRSLKTPRSAAKSR